MPCAAVVFSVCARTPQGNYSTWIETQKALADSNPFWAMDLGVSRNISRMRIYNRNGSAM